MAFWRNDSAARNALAQAVAISKSQAVIEFNMDGTIVTANQNFLDTLCSAPPLKPSHRPDFDHVGYEMLQQILDAVLQCRRR